MTQQRQMGLQRIAAKLPSMAIGFSLKTMLMAICYIAGGRLIGAILQGGMDMGLGFWGVLARPISYSVSYWATIAVSVVLLLLADALTPGRLNRLALFVAAAVAGAYYYVMYFEYGRGYNLERWYDTLLQRSFPPPLADIFGTACFIILAFLPVIVLMTWKLGARAFRHGAGQTVGGQ